MLYLTSAAANEHSELVHAQIEVRSVNLRLQSAMFHDTYLSCAVRASPVLDFISSFVQYERSEREISKLSKMKTGSAVQYTGDARRIRCQSKTINTTARFSLYSNRSENFNRTGDLIINAGFCCLADVDETACLL